VKEIESNSKGVLLRLHFLGLEKYVNLLTVINNHPRYFSSYLRYSIQKRPFGRKLHTACGLTSGI